VPSFSSCPPKEADVRLSPSCLLGGPTLIESETKHSPPFPPLFPQKNIPVLYSPPRPVSYGPRPLPTVAFPERKRRRPCCLWLCPRFLRPLNSILFLPPFDNRVYPDDGNFRILEENPPLHFCEASPHQDPPLGIGPISNVLFFLVSHFGLSV